MGVRILVGHAQGDHGVASEIACLFDSVTGRAFGPIFERGEDGDSPEERAEAFLTWVRDTGRGDVRVIPFLELTRLYDLWVEQNPLPRPDCP